MHATLREFMVAADMVEMRVAGDAGEIALAHQRHVAFQAEMAKTGVEQQIAITAAHMPHVAAEEWLYPRLVDERDVVAHADGFVPVRSVDYRKCAHRSVRQQD